MDTTLQDAQTRHRYELLDSDGALLGFVTYLVREVDGTPVRVLNHTIVEPSAQGRGVGGTLVRGVLDDMRSRGEKVVPVCPFVDGWMAKHPEYEDMRAAR